MVDMNHKNSAIVTAEMFAKSQASFNASLEDVVMNTLDIK